jgi:hypothetical protein
MEYGDELFPGSATLIPAIWFHLLNNFLGLLKCGSTLHLSDVAWKISTIVMTEFTESQIILVYYSMYSRCYAIGE